MRTIKGIVFLLAFVFVLSCSFVLCWANDTINTNLTLSENELVEENEIPIITRKSLLEVTTVGDGFVKINDEQLTLPSNFKNSYDMGTRIKLVATANPDSEFVYWEDSDVGKIISTQPVYEFIMGTGENLKAVFYRTPKEETNFFTVLFKDRSQRILQSSYVSRNFSVRAPRVTEMIGYEFTGWDKDYRNVNSNMIISARFIRLPDKYSINVVGGMLPTGDTQGEYQFDMPIRVVANEAEEGKKFSHWEQDGVRISSKIEFTFFMPKRDTVLTAVYVEESDTIDTKPFITLAEDVLIDINDNTIMFCAYRNTTYGYKLIESGVILLNSRNEMNNPLTLNTENRIRGKIDNNSTDQFYIRKLNVRSDDIWFGRAYMVYEDLEGNIITVYSKTTASGSLKDAKN
ncbi:UNVERIFIED_CONTAM: hypothetical protein Cloal_2448 [Acetivibrio alkalicellulosi]